MPATVTKHEDPIIVETALGRALCIAWLDWDKPGEQEWECVLLHNGAIVFFPHTKIRVATNASLGITAEKLTEVPAALAGLKAK